MAAISITAGSVVPQSDAVFSKDYLFGATITQGQAVYLDLSQNPARWEIADNGAEATANVKGIATSAGADGQPGVVQTGGSIAIGGTVSVGKPYVLGTSGGIIPVDDATATGTVYSSLIGIGTTTGIIKLGFLVSGVEYAADVE
jgi:hypothetical protein